MTDEHKHLGNMAVKIIGQDDETVTVAGWGVVFGGFDLEGDTFTKDTDYQLGLVPVKPVFYDHTLGAVKSSLGTVKSAEEKSDDGIDGLWIEAELHKSQSYVSEVIHLAEMGVLGWSSGSIGHLVRRENKSIKTWPVVEWSLTATPAEPRTIGAQLYKAIAAVNESLQALEQEPGEGSDSATNDVEPVDIEKIQNVESAKAQTEVHKKMDEKEVVEQTKETEVKTPEFKIDYDRIIKGVSDEMKAAAPVKTAPAVLKIPRYSDNTETDEFLHYIKTGRPAGVYKAALQEGTASEGGVLVPDDFYNKIIAKRDERSIVRLAGAMVIPTSRDVIQVPVELTTSAFTVAAEEGSYSESEPTFNSVAITVHKATNLIKVSEELMEDDATNLEPFLVDMLGRAAAAWENDAHLVGTGTAEPYGVYAGGTAALSSDFATTIGAGEIPELWSKLPEPYELEAVWLMRKATYWNQIRSLTGNPFQFNDTPAAGGGPGSWSLLGAPVYMSDQNPPFTTAQKAICVANFRFYAVVERRGFRMSRNPYLYQASGQIGLFTSFRQGGSVLQAEAFQYLTTA